MLSRSATLIEVRVVVVMIKFFVDLLLFQESLHKPTFTACLKDRHAQRTQGSEFNLILLVLCEYKSITLPPNSKILLLVRADSTNGIMAGMALLLVALTASGGYNMHN
jgi:hypothetical protein